MGKGKKVLAILLVFALLMALGIPAFAAGNKSTGNEKNTSSTVKQGAKTSSTTTSSNATTSSTPTSTINTTSTTDTTNVPVTSSTTTTTGAQSCPTSGCDSFYTTGSKLSQAVSEFYRVDPIDVVTVGQNYINPDDVLVTLLIANAARRSPIEINNLRKQSLSWMTIMDRYNINPSVLFMSIPANVSSVPSQFSHAYEQYNRFRSNPNYKMTLYDNEIRNLAGLDFMVRRYSLSPITTMQMLGTTPSNNTYTRLILDRVLASQTPGTSSTINTGTSTSSTTITTPMEETTGGTTSGTTGTGGQEGGSSQGNISNPGCK